MLTSNTKMLPLRVSVHCPPTCAGCSSYPGRGWNLVFEIAFKAIGFSTPYNPASRYGGRTKQATKLMSKKVKN